MENTEIIGIIIVILLSIAFSYENYQNVVYKLKIQELDKEILILNSNLTICNSQIENKQKVSTYLTEQCIFNNVSTIIWCKNED